MGIKKFLEVFFRMVGNNEETSISGPDLGVNILVCLCTVLLLITCSLNVVTPARFHDGSLTGLARYTITFDAYEVIENDNSDKVIFLGSSKMREAINGHLIQELSNDDFSVYNLGYAGERPYHRMVELDAMIQSNPDVVVLELGPNSFSSLSTPLEGGNLEKMNLLMALSGKSPSSGLYYDLLSPEDRDILPKDRVDSLKYLNTFTPKAYEYSLSYAIGTESPPFDCKINVQCSPSPNSDEFSKYLRYPPQFPDWLESYREQNREEIYFDKYLSPFYNHSLHSAEGIYNKNHISYDFIIQSLLKNDIAVILIALPYHPRAQENAPPDHWDYVNQSIESYTGNQDILVADWFWEDWGNESFIDISHFSRKGEIETANRMNTILKEYF